MKKDYAQIQKLITFITGCKKGMTDKGCIDIAENMISVAKAGLGSINPDSLDGLLPVVDPHRDFKES